MRDEKVMKRLILGVNGVTKIIFDNIFVRVRTIYSSQFHGYFRMMKFHNIESD